MWETKYSSIWSDLSSKAADPNKMFDTARICAWMNKARNNPLISSNSSIQASTRGLLVRVF